MNFLKYLRVRGLSREDAEDVVNDAFLILYKIWGRAASSDNRAAFAFKLLRDVLNDHYRRRGRSLATVELYSESVNAEQGQAKASPNEMDSLIGVLDVHQAIAELPERQADCMRLHVLFDQDIDEVALYLGISASAVTSSLYYARRKLAARLGDSDGEEVAAG